MDILLLADADGNILGAAGVNSDTGFYEGRLAKHRREHTNWSADIPAEKVPSDRHIEAWGLDVKLEKAYRLQLAAELDGK